MSEAMAIPARDVADSVGLPPVWHSIHGRGNTGEGWVTPGLPWDHHDNVDLTDPQTKDGLYRQLAAWAGHDPAGGPYFHCWDYDGHFCLMRAAGWGKPEVVWCAPWKFGTEAGVFAHIARDHRIRRSLGWDVQPGTLAEWDRFPDGWRCAVDIDMVALFVRPERWGRYANTSMTRCATALAEVGCNHCGSRPALAWAADGLPLTAVPGDRCPLTQECDGTMVAFAGITDPAEALRVLDEVTSAD